MVQAGDRRDYITQYEWPLPLSQPCTVHLNLNASDHARNLLITLITSVQK